MKSKQICSGQLLATFILANQLIGLKRWDLKELFETLLKVASYMVRYMLHSFHWFRFYQERVIPQDIQNGIG